MDFISDFFGWTGHFLRMLPWWVFVIIAAWLGAAGWGFWTGHFIRGCILLGSLFAIWSLPFLLIRGAQGDGMPMIFWGLPLGIAAVAFFMAIMFWIGGR